MYPYDLFWGLDLYDLLIAVGFFAALVYFRLWADRLAFSAKLQNLVIASALCALFGGFFSAALFQAFYHYLDAGVLTLSAGSTFYGGLIGGALIFLAVYFLGGRLFLGEGVAARRFFAVSEIAAGSIALAHGFGRLGCLMAGCCHGEVTDAWCGVYNVTLGAKTVPLQLFEALFLFVLTFLLSLRLWKGRRGNLGLYLIVYAIWRFFIEYFRADERGATVVSFLSPSQLMACLLVLFGIALWWLEYRLDKKSREKGEMHDA
ncbi:MAG: prolipoprotein diacylglyceryl transferase [Clostridia bacterium]|nr:prolipoprotein diacylglyceryl transferase [Clostridia bacterium]